MTYRLSLWSSLREDARDYYLTAMDASIPRTASTETPEERERLLSQSLPRDPQAHRGREGAEFPVDGGRSD